MTPADLGFQGEDGLRDLDLILDELREHSIEGQPRELVMPGAPGQRDRHLRLSQLVELRNALARELGLPE